MTDKEETEEDRTRDFDLLLGALSFNVPEDKVLNLLTILKELDSFNMDTNHAKNELILSIYKKMRDIIEAIGTHNSKEYLPIMQELRYLLSDLQ